MIYKINEGFLINEINPFTNITYDDSWIIFCLTNSNDYEIMNGGGVSFAYILKVSKKYPEWKMSVMDFIEFQENYNKNIIISISDADYNEAKKHYCNHHYNEKCLRNYEPDFFVHSTTWENWLNINNDGCLKSWNKLKREKVNWEDIPIGKELGDPNDFSDYIMFSSGSISGEIVVLAKQNGKIIMNQDMQYQTGVRLYFDVKKIAQDGLLIRDGCHLKVKDILPLNPYLLWVCDWKNAGLKNNISTPKEFTVLANEMFNKLFNAKIKTTF